MRRHFASVSSGTAKKTSKINLGDIPFFTSLLEHFEGPYRSLKVLRINYNEALVIVKNCIEMQSRKNECALFVIYRDYGRLP